MASPQASAAVPSAPASTSSFDWLTGIRDLFRLHPVPPGWWRATGWILLCNAVLIAVLIWLGRLFFNDPSEMFRERRPGTFATVAALVCAGIVCFKIRRRVIDRPVAGFWLALGIMMCVAGADDLFTIHEHVDKYFHRITGLSERNPVTDHIDDVLVASYVLPAFYLALRHCKRLLAVPFTIQLLALAFAMFALHLVFDWLGLSATAEECIKQTAACVIWIAMLATLFQSKLPASWET